MSMSNGGVYEYTNVPLMGFPQEILSGGNISEADGMFLLRPDQERLLVLCHPEESFLRGVVHDVATELGCGSDQVWWSFQKHVALRQVFSFATVPASIWLASVLNKFNPILQINANPIAHSAAVSHR